MSLYTQQDSTTIKWQADLQAEGLDLMVQGAVERQREQAELQGPPCSISPGE